MKPPTFAILSNARSRPGQYPSRETIQNVRISHKTVRNLHNILVVESREAEIAVTIEDGFMEGVPRGIKSSRILESLAILNSRLDLERLLPTLLDVSLRLTGGERAFLLLYKEKDLLVRIARDRAGYDLPEEDFVGSMTVVERVLEQKESLYVPRLDEVNEFADAESVRAMKLTSAICLPLFP